MEKQRFFALLHFAREIGQKSANNELIHLLLKTFYLGFTVGTKEKGDCHEQRTQSEQIQAMQRTPPDVV